MQYLLAVFGWFAVITSSLLILVPYLRGKRDLITSWTFYQLGCLNFIGVASIQSGHAIVHTYIVPHPQDYVKFVTGGVLFYIVSILTYYYFIPVQSFADRRMRKVGSRTPRALLGLLPVALLLTIGYLFVPNIQFLGQWMMLIGKASVVIAVALVMVAWAQRPYNAGMVVLVGLVLLIAVVATSSEFSRRDFLSAITTAVVCWYWLRARYYNTARVVVTLSIWGSIGMFLLAGYSIARFARVNPDMNIVQVAWAKVMSIPDSFSHPDSTKQVFGGDTTEASLAVIRLYDQIQPTQPFHTLKYILLHPVPRAWWPSKPIGLGITLPLDTGFSRAHGSAANLGPGVIGHGFHEGGLFFVAFYAFLFAAASRFFDSLVLKDPSNPYLLGALGAASGQLIGLVRGEIGLFAVQIISAFLAAMLFNYLGRIFFGTEYLPTPEEAAQLQAYESYSQYGTPQNLDVWAQQY